MVKLIISPFLMRTDTPKYYLSKNHDSPIIENDLALILSYTHPHDLIIQRRQDIYEQFEKNKKVYSKPAFKIILDKSIRPQLLTGLLVGTSQ